MSNPLFGSDGFNREEVEPARGYEPIVPGKYPVQITEEIVRETKKRDGHYLQLELTIFEGQYKDRKLWARLNLDNPNPKAVNIARRELSAICYAVDIPGISPNSGPEELHGRWMYVQVKIKDDQNEVKAFFHPKDPVILKMLSQPQPVAQATSPPVPVAPVEAPPVAEPAPPAHAPAPAPIQAVGFEQPASPVAPVQAPAQAPPVATPAQESQAPPQAAGKPPWAQ